MLQKRVFIDKFGLVNSDVCTLETGYMYSHCAMCSKQWCRIHIRIALSASLHLQQCYILLIWLQKSVRGGQIQERRYFILVYILYIIIL